MAQNRFSVVVATEKWSAEKKPGATQATEGLVAITISTATTNFGFN